MGGLHPVVALYATFLNRAFDQVLMDVALHKCGVTFVLDRAGVTGDDGASHNGMWDMSILQVVPGLRLAAPRDGARLRELLRRGRRGRRRPDRACGSPRAPPPGHRGDRPGRRLPTYSSAPAPRDVLIVAVGSMAATAVDVADRLAAQGIGVTVVDPRWVKPVDPALVELAREHRLVVSVEDNGVVGGCGAVLLQALNDAGVHTPVPAARHPAAVPRPRQARGDPRADRADRPGAGPRHRRGHVRVANGELWWMPTTRASGAGRGASHCCWSCSWSLSGLSACSVLRRRRRRPHRRSPRPTRPRGR